MDTNELQKTLQKLNYGKITNRELATLWGIDETSVSRKKRLKTQLTVQEIAIVEQKIGKSLTNINHEDNLNLCKNTTKYNINHLKNVIISFEEYIKNSDINITPEKKADIIILFYKLYANDNYNITDEIIAQICNIAK